MEVSPNVLEFKGSFIKPTTEYLILSNTSSTPLAFKVKTTAPKLYCVRPNASVVEPGATVKISIILQGFASPLPKDYKCKDKFLLVSLPCPDLKDSTKVSEVWSELESKYKQQLVSKKLRVNYSITDEEEEEEEVNEPKPTESQTEKSINGAPDNSNGYTESPAPVSDSADASTAAGIVAASKLDKSKPASDLQRELDESSAQINNLSEKLDSNEKSESAPSGLDATTSTPDSSETKSEEPVNGISLPFAFILVLLAFLLGWLIF